MIKLGCFDKEAPDFNGKFKKFAWLTYLLGKS